MTTFKMRPGWMRYAGAAVAATVAVFIPTALKNPSSSYQMLSPTVVTSSAPGSFSARVERVIDGDTFEITVGQPSGAEGQLVIATLQKVRLFGIDAPEKAQPGGLDSSQWLNRWLGKQNVTIQPMGTDMYGRTIAKAITSAGKDVSLELAFTGNAWWYAPLAPSATAYRDAEATARAEKKALWSGTNPIEPWRWRQGVR